MEMDSRKPGAENGQIEFAEASGIGDHVHFCDFPLLHCAANHDTQPPAGRATPWRLASLSANARQLRFETTSR
jgi:hypothetical protein